MADRAHGIPNTVDMQFGHGERVKVFTALAVDVPRRRRARSALATTPARCSATTFRSSTTGVTIEHLLSHRSGIGDYLDEDEWVESDDYMMPVSVHELDTTESFLAVLDGLPD